MPGLEPVKYSDMYDTHKRKLLSVYNDPSSTHLIEISDLSKLVNMTADAANDIDIDESNITTQLPNGSRIEYVSTGSGDTTIRALNGSYLNGVENGSCTITKKYSIVTVFKMDTNQYLVSGETTEVA